MQVYPSFVETIRCVVGLFASKEMEEYDEGKVSNLMTLVWKAATSQI